jgi:hypothetical protein
MQELFDKCKAMEEENFANASECFNHTLDIRLGFYSRQYFSSSPPR